MTKPYSNKDGDALMYRIRNVYHEYLYWTFTDAHIK